MLVRSLTAGCDNPACRMVLDTSYDLLMFFVFLSVIFLGFVLAIVVSRVGRGAMI